MLLSSPGQLGQFNYQLIQLLQQQKYIFPSMYFGDRLPT